MTYEPHGVCSQLIEFTITEDNTLHAVTFTGGCSGNTQGISRLIEGMDVDEAIQRLRGITCGRKPTSCPDQFAQALQAAKRSS